MSILNERESMIMSYKAQGFTSKEIAKILNLEFRTIDTYFGHIKKKLRARNTAHAIYLTLESERDA